MNCIIVEVDRLYVGTMNNTSHKLKLQKFSYFLTEFFMRSFKQESLGLTLNVF